MAEIVKRNFDAGKQLLVAVLLLSINLVIQLFAVADTVDISNGVQFTGMGVNMAISYLLTAVCMIIVLQEFFQIKTKMRGLLALNALLDRTPSPIVKNSETSTLEEANETQTIETVDPLSELVIDDDEDFDSLLDELEDENEFVDTDEEGVPSVPIDEDIMSRYRTTKLKIDDETGEMEPIIDDGGLQDLIEQADLATDEELQLAKIVAESEIIQTLNELEGIVQELKAKKAVEN